MSRGRRLGILGAAVVVAVVAFVIISPGGSDNKSSGTSAPSGPQQAAIDIRAGAPVGGIQRIQVKKGASVTITVSSDAPHPIHLHGYDVLKHAAPGKPAVFRFRATIDGRFRIEEEDSGTQVGSLEVLPS